MIDHFTNTAYFFFNEREYKESNLAVFPRVLETLRRPAAHSLKSYGTAAPTQRVVPMSLATYQWFNYHTQ